MGMGVSVTETERSTLRLTATNVNRVIEALKPSSPLGMNADLAIGCLSCVVIYFSPRVDKQEMHRILDQVWDWLNT